MTGPVPAPMTVANLWQLTAAPHQLEELAQARRAQGKAFVAASDDLIKAAGKVYGQSWTGIAADQMDRRRKEISKRLDAIGAVADQIARVLDEIAASQRVTQQHLLDSLQRIAAARVTMTVSGTQIIFYPADDVGIAVVKREFATAQDIRKALDTTMARAAKELRRLNEELRRHAAWSAASAGATKEEARLARQRFVVDQILAKSGLADRIEKFKEKLAKVTSADEAERLMKTEGEELWRLATKRVRDGVASGQGALADDRPLYWARLEMESAVRQWNPSFTLDPAKRDELIDGLDKASRGMTSDSFTSAKRVFVTGFDPFQLEPAQGGDPRRSNPSGAAAMALDGTFIDVKTPNGVERYQVQAVVLPVKFGDFDQGLATEVFADKMTGPDKAAMIVTVSQGGSQFELEHFYSDQSGSTPDNNDVVRSGTIPGLTTSGVLESTLPEDRMAATRPRDAIVDRSNPYPEGSGGDYLSNEVPRRVADLREQLAPGMPTGHLHTPALTLPTDPDAISSKTIEAERLKIINGVREVIQGGLKP